MCFRNDDDTVCPPEPTSSLLPTHDIVCPPLEPIASPPHEPTLFDQIGLGDPTLLEYDEDEHIGLGDDSDRPTEVYANSAKS